MNMLSVSLSFSLLSYKKSRVKVIMRESVCSYFRAERSVAIGLMMRLYLPLVRETG